ncbi:MAG: DUF362 domain-containing protein, partial [Eubacterium aggregans]
IEVLGEPVDSVMKHFKLPNGDPIGRYNGLTCCMQQTCDGCYVNVRGALDSFAIRGINMDKFLKERGEVVGIAGGVPSFDPEICVDKTVFICGDCWEKFETADAVREGAKKAKKVVCYPGCAPVYIFSKLNTDLQKMAAGQDID